MRKKIPKPDKITAFLSPRYWPTWLGLGILYLIAQLPYSWQIAIGRNIGRLAYHLMHNRRHIADVNLKLCFPEKTAAQRTQLIKKNFESIGIGIVEMGMAWWAPEKTIAQLPEPKGLEHLQAAFANGKGAILLCGHFTTLEITARIVGKKSHLHTIYREQKNPLFNFIMERSRKNIVEDIIPRHDIRSIVKALKNNKSVYYAGDQDFGKKYSVFVPFFGVQAATIVSLVRLCEMTGAQVIPSTHYRLDGNPYYDLTYHKPLENFPSGDLEKDLLRLNHEIEKMILQHPEQYYWIHRRFKTRPEGEQKPY